MADGIIQVPPDSTGKKVDAASIDVGANTVYRQRIIIGDNSATGQFALVTGGALTVAGTMNISAMPTVTVTGSIGISGTATVVGSVGATVTGLVGLTAGTANIGHLNHISRTVEVSIATPFTVNNISATVNVAGTFTISTIDAISATVQVAIATPFTVNNISATVVTSGLVGLTAGAANIGHINHISRTVEVTISTPFTINNISASVAVTGNFSATSTVVIAAGTANIGTINNISATVNVAGTFSISVIDAISATVQVAIATPFTVNNISATVITSGLVGLTAGAANIGHINHISRTVEVTISTPFTVNNISASVAVTGNFSATSTVVIAAGAANIGTINNISATVNVAGTFSISVIDAISATVQVAIATPFTVNNISATVTIAGNVFANVGSVNNISATVNTIITGFLDGSGSVRNLVESAAIALRVNIVTEVGAQYTIGAGLPVTLNAGAANIGFINNISATVVTGLSYVIEKTSNSQVQVGDSANAAVRVNVVAGSAGGPSMTDNTTYSTGASLVAPSGFIFFSASAVGVTDGRIAAARMTEFRAVHTNLRLNDGTEIGNTSATGLFVRTATVAFAAGSIVNNISATVTVAGVVGLTAGSAVIGDINAISRTVQVAIGTPFILQGISTSVTSVISSFKDASGDTKHLVESGISSLRVCIVQNAYEQVDNTTFSTGVTYVKPTAYIFFSASAVAVTDGRMAVPRITEFRGVHTNLRNNAGTEIGTSTTPLSVKVENQSATLTTVIAGFTPTIMSASHGPKCVTCSTSAAVTLIASPGAGASVHITQLNVSNAGAAGSLARIGTSASANTVVMFCASAGGGFVLNFDPPWKLSASEAAICSVKPNTSSAYFNVQFYVAA